MRAHQQAPAAPGRRPRAAAARRDELEIRAVGFLGSGVHREKLCEPEFLQSKSLHSNLNTKTIRR
ncbi:hypothetical protein ACFPRL_04675 [Pseudoclavibacter helvolus]